MSISSSTVSRPMLANVKGSVAGRPRKAGYKPTNTFYSRASPVNCSRWLCEHHAGHDFDDFPIFVSNGKYTTSRSSTTPVPERKMPSGLRPHRFRWRRDAIATVPVSQAAAGDLFEYLLSAHSDGNASFAPLEPLNRGKRRTIPYGRLSDGLGILPAPNRQQQEPYPKKDAYGSHNDQRNRAAAVDVDFTFRVIRRSGSRICSLAFG